MPRLGAHMSIAGGVHRALERGASIGCDCVQIFLKNNMQWRGASISEAAAERFAQAQQATGISPVFAHSSYLINLAAVNERFRELSIRALADEIERADLLQVPWIVMHPGAHMGAGEKIGLQTIARSLDQVFEETRQRPVRIALEITAGQGTNLGYRFEHLAELFKMSEHPHRLAVCLDTCHLFAAGYDIRTAKSYSSVMRRLDKVIGCGQVVAFHLNDSKRPLGARVDRHEHIGKGLLGLAAFRCILRDPRWHNIPMVIETPKSNDLHEDVENLQVLRGLQ